MIRVSVKKIETSEEIKYLEKQLQYTDCENERATIFKIMDIVSEHDRKEHNELKKQKGV